MTPSPPSSMIEASPWPSLAYRVHEHTPLRRGFLSLGAMTLSQQRPDGSWSPPFVREVLERGHAVTGVLHDPQLDRVLLVGQLRPGGIVSGDPWVWDMVAGMIDAGESPVTAFRREAEEEAHVTVGDVVRIGRFYPSVGGSSETVEVFYAAVDLSAPLPWGGCPDEHEYLAVITPTVDEALQAVADGRIVSATAALGLYWLMGHPERRQPLVSD